MTKGEAAEAKAVEFLKKRAYRILARNFRARCGEIDIVAWHDGVLCFVEVKSRRTQVFGPPAAAVTLFKQKQIIHTAQVYLQKNYPQQQPACRFDVVSIVGDQAPELISAAFTA